MALDVFFSGKPTLIGACTGVVAGLVGITPAAGFVPIWCACTGVVAGLVGITPAAGFVPIWSSFIIGLLVSPVCYGGILLVKKKLKIDDSLDAFGCHGIGGIFGGIMTGLFADPAVNETAGLFFGDAAQLGRQVLAIVISIALAVVGSLICAGIVKVFTALRVDKRNELVGLDVSEHGENAYPAYNGLD